MPTRGNLGGSMEPRAGRGGDAAARYMEKLKAQKTAASESSRFDTLIKSLEGDVALDKAVADAQAFLLDRYDRFTALGLPTDLAKPFEELENLSGVDYPKAFQSPVKGGGRVRIGTEFEMNDITGERTIVPSADPVEKGKALTLFEGTQDQALQSRFGQDAAQIPHKTEYVQRQLMRRMGLPAVMNNDETATATDFTVGGKKIDGQTHRTTWDGDGKLQAYTWVNGPGETPWDNQGMTETQRQASADNVKDIILDEMDANPSRGLQGVVTDLGEDGVLSGAKSTGYMPTPGKLFQEGAYKKDGIVITDYDPKFHLDNKHAGDTISKAPKDIRMQDFNRARDVVNNMSSDEVAESLRAFPNETRGGKFPGRTQLHIIPTPEQAAQYTVSSERIRRDTPQVRQFLDETPSVVRGVSRVLRNPAVRVAGAALGAIPVLGDAADATTGAIDVVTGTSDQTRRRGAANFTAGAAGLTALAAPVTAPVLAPVSLGTGLGVMASDNAHHRRENDPKLTRNSDKFESKGTFIDTPEAPVTIQAPTPVQNEWQKRLDSRRSSSARRSAPTPARPSTAKGWWQQAQDAVMGLFGQ